MVRTQEEWEGKKISAVFSRIRGSFEERKVLGQ